MIGRLTIVACLVLVTACGGIKSTKLTPENRAEVEKQVAASNLSEEDKKAFTGALGLEDFRQAFGGGGGGQGSGASQQQDSLVYGKSVGEIIAFGKDAERRISEGMAEEQAKEARLAAETKQRDDMFAAEFKKSLTVSFYDRAKTQDPYGFAPDLTLKFALKNNGSKEIKGVKGTYEIYDQFGDQLDSGTLKYDATLKPGETKTHVIKEQMVFENENKLSQTPMSDLKFKWVPETIIYSDGTRLEKPASS